MSEEFFRISQEIESQQEKNYSVSLHVLNFVFIPEEKDLSADFFFCNFLNFHNIQKFFCIMSSLMSKKI